ncbi:SusC/RagA family TonB-linked outer membrane protein [Fulvivirgaceae bacterium BMA12]|uniref:SusC/RagA family TonB-linked outer membrane protein n=1 Tax=Agaribacillus aureus TaxID=3051825 RepID=A0ABT8LKZ9_9BACT|nr:SusC/RagA family TonB-linked outer membrane protein [Fulvivirgaceae bacterium BMA12]
MKSKLLRLIIMFGKYALFISVIQCMGLTMLLASNSTAQRVKSVKETYVRVGFDNADLKEVIAEIESRTDYKFIYQDNLLADRESMTLNMDVRKRSVADILLKLSQKGRLGFKQINNSINVKTLSLENRNRPLEIVRDDIVVSGKVTDESYQPLPGVNVLIKGTAQGTVTKSDGTYSLSAPEDGVLVFSFIGYHNVEVDINSRSVIDVTLLPDLETLEEVVVIGYGTRTKGELTGAITTVNDDYLKQQPVANVSRALQGSASGVTVIAPATPGGDAEIRIRGMGTINNNNPLWVVDGVYDADPPPPNQVESIQILKDASSTAIYGARGANGVILVTTKTGLKGQKKPQVEFNLSTGFVSPDAKFDLLTDPELIGQTILLELNNDNITPAHPHFNFGGGPADVTVNEFLFPNGGVSGNPNTDLSLYDQQNYPITRTNLQGTDWLDVIYRNASIQNFNLAVSGGSERTSYSFHGNYTVENGLLEHTSYDRYAIRSNVDSEINDWLKIGQRLGVTFEENKGYNGNNGRGLFRSINEVSPLIPVRDEAGNFAGGIVGGLNDGPNPLGFLERQKENTNRRYTISGNFYAEVEPIKGLIAKTLFGYNLRNGNTFGAQLPAYEDTNGARSTNLNEGSSNNRLWNWSNTLNYRTSIAEDHNLDVLVGYEARRTTFRFINASVNDFFSTDINFLVLDAGAGIRSNNGSAGARTTSSVFGRLHYDFQGKYLADITIRRDGSSVLGNDKYGTFPAFSVGWNISEEGFMAGVGSWLTYLKIRASYGESGNDQVGGFYNSFTTFASSQGGSFYAIDGSDSNITLGYQSAAIGNPDARWETTTSTNIAIDATLFGALDVTVDLWKKDTDDMLFPVAIPAVVGVARAPSINIGSMQNKGIDITLDYRGDISDDLTYHVAATFSTFTNEITGLSNTDGEFIAGNDVRGQIYTRAEVGSSFPEFFGYVVDGIFQTQEQADAHAVNGTYNQPGNLIVRDIDGDGTITPEDRTFIGSPLPDFTTGLNLGIQFKGFDVSATFYASVGNDIANYTSRFRRYGLFQGPKAPDRLFRSWGSPFLDDNRNAVLPKASSTTSFEQNASTEYIEDGSFIRLQNLQLGYNFSNNLLEKIHLSNLRIYVQGSNLFTITDYSGLDPELPVPFLNGGRWEINRGIDIGGWPISRQFLIGLNVTL